FYEMTTNVVEDHVPPELLGHASLHDALLIAQGVDAVAHQRTLLPSRNAMYAATKPDAMAATSGCALLVMIANCPARSMYSSISLKDARGSARYSSRLISAGQNCFSTSASSTYSPFGRSRMVASGRSPGATSGNE